MKLSLPNFVTTNVATQSLVLQKHSPKLLFAAGLGLMGATVVTSARATLRLEDVLDEVRQNRIDVQAAADVEPERFSTKEVQRLNAYITMKGIGKVAKLYLPSLALGVAAVACLTSSHNQLTRRNAGLSAALAATERALDSYRSRVRDAYGDERELEIWRDEKVEKEPVFDEDGNATKKTKKVKTGGGQSPYARVWGRDTSTEWDPQPEYNLSKIRSVQEYLTLRLNSRGHVFLNEAFDELGLERTPAGQVVGWLSKKYGGADGFVDFGVIDRASEIDQLEFLDFVTGREDSIMLDFNVDGEVWRKI